MFTSGLGLSAPNADKISARVSGVERDSKQPLFWPAEEPTEFTFEVQELEKEDYEGFFIPMMGNLILYLIKSGFGMLILFLLFILIDLFFGEILIDMIFEDACFGFPGEDCS